VLGTCCTWTCCGGGFSLRFLVVKSRATSAATTTMSMMAPMVRYSTV